MSEGGREGGSEGVSEGASECRQLRPSSRREHVSASNSQI